MGDLVASFSFHLLVLIIALMSFHVSVRMFDFVWAGATNQMFCGTRVALVDFMITEREYALLRTGAVVDPSPLPHPRLERDILLPTSEILLQGGGWMHDIK